MAAAIAAAADEDVGSSSTPDGGQGAGAAAAEVPPRSAPPADRHHLGHAAAAFTESDAALVALGAKQTARALAKLVSRGHAPSLESPPLAACRDAVAGLADALKRVCWHLFGAAPERVVGASALPRSLLPPQRAGAATAGDSEPTLPFVPITSVSDVVVPAAALSWRGLGSLTHLADDCLAFAGYRYDPPDDVNVSLLPLSRLPSQQRQGAHVEEAAAAEPLRLPLVADCAGAARAAVRSLADIAAVLAHVRTQARRGAAPFP